MTFKPSDITTAPSARNQARRAGPKDVVVGADGL